MGDDADEMLLSEYLAGHLNESDVAQVEDRLRSERPLREKLADLLLVQGLVQMAMSDEEPKDADCARARRLFQAYRTGKTTEQQTAMLSRHLEDCAVCEVGFERGVVALSRVRRMARWTASNRRPLLAGLLLGAIVAITWTAMPALWSDDTAPPVAESATDPAVPSGAGGIRDADAVRAAVAAVLRSDPSLEESRLRDRLEDALDPATTPQERRGIYEQLQKDFGGRIEPVVFALAENEPDEGARIDVFHIAAGKPVHDRRRLAQFARREWSGAQRDTMIPLVMLIGANPSPEGDQLLREIAALGNAKDPVWQAQFLQTVASTLRADPPTIELIAGALAHDQEMVRVLAARALANVKDRRGVDTALVLVEKTGSPRIRRLALRILKDEPHLLDLDRVSRLPWQSDPETRRVVEHIYKERQVALPSSP